MHALSKLTQRGLRALCSPRQLSHPAVRNLVREYHAVSGMVRRTSLPVQSALLQHYLHTSPAALYNGNEPGAGGNNKKKPNEEEEKRNKQMQRKAALWLLTAYIFVVLLGVLFPSTGPPEHGIRYVSWQEFVHHMLARGEVERILVRPDVNSVLVHLHEGAIIKGKKVDQLVYHLNVVDIDKVEEKVREVEQSLGLVGSAGVPVEYSRAADSTRLLITKVVVGLVLLGIVLSFRSSINISNMKMDVFPNTRAKFTLIDPLLPGSGRGVKFSDVAGAKEAKQEVMEFVDFLKNPLKYRVLGAKHPKGALLLGPPGCGKTMLAKAVATEGQVPFLAMNGSEFIEMIGGLGAARVRDLFKEAKKRSPCIIYIDEIDAIGRQRGGTGGSGGMNASSGEGEQTLNQLLVEMDGIGTKEGVVLLASTNRLDMLDKALLRPGRFDRHIMLDLPTLEERREILEHHMRAITLQHPPQHYSRRLAALTLGFSGADLANVVNEAALHAARHLKSKVDGDNLEYAIERVVGGAEKKNSSVSPEERRVVAYHESGHALVGWLLKHTDALLKVTIVPRTSHALGFAQYSPSDRKLFSQEELQERMCMALGGRVAESLIFNRVTTGAQNDLQKVTKMAYAQVRSFGFSPAVGQVSFPEGGDGPAGGGRRPYSDRLAGIIDHEANRIIFEAYKQTETIVGENLDKLKLLAEELLQHETVTYEGVERLWGAPPHGPKHVIDPLQFEGEIKSWQHAGEEQELNGNGGGLAS